MLLHDNNTPLLLIGYKESTITQEAEFWFRQEKKSIEVITPEVFWDLSHLEKQQFQYHVAFTLDRAQRKKIVLMLDDMNLNQISYAHPTTVFGSQHPQKILSPGCFVAPYCTLLLESSLGIGTIIEAYCLISHYVAIAKNVHLHAGTMIAGRASIGDNCVLNFRSTVLPKVELCANIELGAISTATKSIDQPGKYVGSPCRRVGDIEVI